MRIYIAGVDGYLGWALAQHLVDRGHEVAGMDNFLRREWVAEMKSQSATLILPMENVCPLSAKFTVKNCLLPKQPLRLRHHL